MKKSVFWIVLVFGIAGYIWQDKIGDFLSNKMTTRPRVSEPDVECEIRNLTCAQLVQALNKLSTARYYDTAGKLMGVSLEDTSIVREGNEVIFKLSDRTKVIHNRALAGSEKGSLTVIYSDGEWMKYNAKGALIAHGMHRR